MSGKLISRSEPETPRGPLPVARWSSIDLTNAAVQGGKFDRLSGALSWYPTSQVRLEFNYGYGRLDRDGVRGRTNFYQLRLQLQL